MDLASRITVALAAGALTLGSAAAGVAHSPLAGSPGSDDARPMHLAALRASAPGLVMTMPCADGRVLRLASIPQPNWKPGHRGIDVACEEGEEVLAPASGTVTFAGVVVNRPLVVIDHGGGIVSALEPVEPGVAVGDRVRKGDVIGTEWNRGDHCAIACVHWSVRVDGAYVNPLDYLEGFGRIRLLDPTRG